jgi:hypothetical protein
VSVSVPGTTGGMVLAVSVAHTGAAMAATATASAKVLTKLSPTLP